MNIDATSARVAAQSGEKGLGWGRGRGEVGRARVGAAGAALAAQGPSPYILVAMTLQIAGIDSIRPMNYYHMPPRPVTELLPVKRHYYYYYYCQNPKSRARAAARDAMLFSQSSSS